MFFLDNSYNVLSWWNVGRNHVGQGFLSSAPLFKGARDNPDVVWLS